jgi:hypothetical protein
MNNRPDPEMFARYSYYLAFVSAFILLLTFLIRFVRVPIASVLINLVWLALVTGIVGAFMGFAASRDFKRKPASDDIMHEARIGFRINLGVTLIMLLLGFFAIVIQVVTSTPIQVK